MALKKYKISHADLPDAILKEDAEGKYLHLRIGRLVGDPVELKIYDGDVIRTEDPFAQAALEAYTPPKIPLKHKPAGSEGFTHVHYDGDEYEETAFATVGNTTQHKHLV